MKKKKKGKETQKEKTTKNSMLVRRPPRLPNSFL
jgi:hypothetical protein